MSNALEVPPASGDHQLFFLVLACGIARVHIGAQVGWWVDGADARAALFKFKGRSKFLPYHTDRSLLLF